MEGAHREGHFQGVATVVQKLFEALQPTVAYFGEKDYQQLQIITALVRQENIPVVIVSCPIIRHEDGLAMSSRNKRLNMKTGILNACLNYLTACIHCCKIPIK